jgi:NAD(P)-dependent dehydrogenase (short-subunit alcohol dehydrogenase family)
MVELRFDDKVVIVTGAGRGVGRSHALDLGSRGARVVVADLGGPVDGLGQASSGPADGVVEEIRSSGGEAVACVASVAEEDGAAKIVQSAIDAFGHHDIVINNAGIADPELFVDHTLDQFRTMLAVQYLGTVYMCKAAWPHLVAQGSGRIVNTCSEGPLGIHRKLTTYGGAKGGVIGFTLTLAAEGPEHGIAVNGFSPRAFTRLSSPEIMSRTYDVPPEVFETSMLPYTPELASPAAIYLAHDSCDLNGVMLVCGGGQVLRMAFAQNDGLQHDAMTPEFVAEHVDEIVDMSDAHIVALGEADRVHDSDRHH